MEENHRIAQYQLCSGMDRCLFNSTNSNHGFGQAHGVMEHAFVEHVAVKRAVAKPTTARRSLAV